MRCHPRKKKVSAINLKLAGLNKLKVRKSQHSDLEEDFELKALLEDVGG